MTTLEHYNTFTKEIQKRGAELNAILSKYDLEISDLLHYLENEKCDAVQMVLVAKKLKEIRIKRREVKTEIYQIQALNDRLKNERHLKSVGMHTYKYKTDAVKGISDRRKVDVLKIVKKNV